MNRIEKRNLIGQIVIGLLYGLFVGVITTDGYTKVAVIAILTAGIKAGAQQGVLVLQPTIIRTGKQYKNEHWTEKFEKML